MNLTMRWCPYAKNITLKQRCDFKKFIFRHNTLRVGVTCDPHRSVPALPLGTGATIAWNRRLPKRWAKGGRGEKTTKNTTAWFRKWRTYTK